MEKKPISICKKENKMYSCLRLMCIAFFLQSGSLFALCKTHIVGDLSKFQSIKVKINSNRPGYTNKLMVAGSLVMENLPKVCLADIDKINYGKVIASYFKNDYTKEVMENGNFEKLKTTLRLDEYLGLNFREKSLELPLEVKRAQIKLSKP